MADSGMRRGSVEGLGIISTSGMVGSQEVWLDKESAGRVRGMAD